MDTKRFEDITCLLTASSFRPTAALICYEGQVPGFYGPVTHVEAFRFDREGRPSAARSVSREALRQIARSVEPEGGEQTHGAIPARMLYADPANATYVWYNPPQRRELSFTAKAGMDDGMYFMPGTIFRAHDDELHAWAFAGRRPTGNTRLLHGPFWNTYKDGKVCQGSARQKNNAKATFEETLLHWEAIFWRSENAHPIFWTRRDEGTDENGTKRIPSLNDTVRQFREAPFDASLLLPTGLRLKDILQRNATLNGQD